MSVQCFESWFGDRKGIQVARSMLRAIIPTIIFWGTRAPAAATQKEGRLQKLRDCLFIAFSALTLSVGHQEEHPAYVKIE